MLKAKLLAMCVCPALLTPPAILAVHKPARHAVAHLLHRAADRLDRSPPPLVAAVDCLPVVAGGVGPGGVPAGDAGLPASIGPLIGDSGNPLPYLATYTGGPGGGFVGGGPGGFGGGGGGGSGGGGSGGAPGTVAGVTPGTGTTSAAPGITSPDTPGTSGVPIANGGTPSATVPEPAAWLFMVAGFGAVGVAARSRRPSLA